MGSESGEGRDIGRWLKQGREEVRVRGYTVSLITKNVSSRDQGVLMRGRRGKEEDDYMESVEREASERRWNK